MSTHLPVWGIRGASAGITTQKRRIGRHVRAQIPGGLLFWSPNRRLCVYLFLAWRIAGGDRKNDLSARISLSRASEWNGGSVWWLELPLPFHHPPGPSLSPAAARLYHACLRSYSDICYLECVQDAWLQVVLGYRAAHGMGNETPSRVSHKHRHFFYLKLALCHLVVLGNDVLYWQGAVRASSEEEPRIERAGKLGLQHSS